MVTELIAKDTSSMEAKEFDYKKAFERNLGWFSQAEQETLRNKRIAFPGLGGVGGNHLNTFLRMGFEKFTISDLDHFEISNFNRQSGATLHSLGKSKVSTMESIARGINPLSDIRKFPSGVTLDNMQDFICGVDLIVDTLDLYQMDLRIALYDLAHQSGIPVVTAGPFGMGTSVLAFSPNEMSFSEYFNLNTSSPIEEKIFHFLVGITPSFLYLKYLVKEEGSNIQSKRLPSVNIGCDAASAALGAISTKILLDRPGLRWAPKGFEADFYRQKSRRFYYPFGNRNPWQRLKIIVFRWIYAKQIAEPKKLHTQVS